MLKNIATNQFFFKEFLEKLFTIVLANDCSQVAATKLPPKVIIQEPMLITL
jgi:hypothetical protein